MNASDLRRRASSAQLRSVGVDLFRGAALGKGGEELHDVVSLDGWMVD
jgi:hypothetical protein